MAETLFKEVTIKCKCKFFNESSKASDGLKKRRKGKHKSKD